VRLEVLRDADAVAAEGARRVASAARDAVAARGVFSFAVSGGSTPWKMLAALSAEPLRWESIHVFQVDERIAPAGDPDRNLTHLRESLVARVPLPSDQVYPMNVEASDLEKAARAYQAVLERRAGHPPVLDLVHLGLGPDGHTASLVPGDPVCQVSDREVALTAAPYQDRLRMTVTFPLLARARRLLWLVTGASKAEMLRRLLAGDESIPGGRVERARALVLADAAAGGDAGE